MYDVAVIGAGINGTVTAFMLHQAGKKVVVFDKGGMASGGSGAAGAFLSPKFVKSGELKNLINTALDEAFDFYPAISEEFFHTYPLLHIAKDEKDAKNLLHVKQNDPLPFLENPPITPKNEYIYTAKSAIVDAKEMCETLLKDIEFQKQHVTSLEYKNGKWILDKTLQVKTVVLATGAYKHLLDEVYLTNVIRGIWGHRIDIKTTTFNPLSIHQFVSISPSKNGVLSIGATHDVHFHPENHQEYDLQKGRDELLEKASQTLDLENVKVIRDYTGLRSGTYDYIPVIGKIVNSTKTIQKLSTKELTRKKADYTQYRYYPDLYMINGSAGYGFVLAPYLAKYLVEYIVFGKEFPRELEAARFFSRYVRKSR